MAGNAFQFVFATTSKGHLKRIADLNLKAALIDRRKDALAQRVQGQGTGHEAEGEQKNALTAFDGSNQPLDATCAGSLRSSQWGW